MVLSITAPGRAAQYVRMSTELQDFSITSQIAVNSAYAEAHGLEIVQTYSDAGISGLGIAKREGLKALLADVVGGSPPFSTILVYDVSRWGRFQNPDQAAHYEFLCAEAGVKVEYCAEAFANDGSPSSALLKHIKRAMAAEYSRELSAKVRNAKRGLAQRGYWIGGAAPYGFTRQVYDESGEALVTADSAHWRKRQGLHTRLVHGPSAQIRLVREIFRRYLEPGASKLSVTADLNEEGFRTEKGHRWTPNRIAYILRCQLYIGRNVVGRRKSDLGRSTEVVAPPEEWLIIEGIVPPIVSQRLFSAVAKKLDLRRPGTVSTAEALADLRRIAKEQGDISQRLINLYGKWSMGMYARRVGSIAKIRELIGVPRSAKYHYLDAMIQNSLKRRLDLGRTHTDEYLIKRLADIYETNGRVDYALMAAAPNMPTVSTYTRRFGSMLAAYRRAGFEPGPEQMRSIEGSAKRWRVPSVL